MREKLPPDANCHVCGRKMFSHKEKPLCNPCRRTGHSVSKVRLNCATCGAEVIRQARHLGKNAYCNTTCFNKRADRVAAPERIRRAQRNASAPGLTYTQVDALRSKWRKQGRMCTYCGTRAGIEVDHVVPLQRGGTNWEGNLAPACKRCNSSKCNRLNSEWKHKRSIPASQRIDKAYASKPHVPQLRTKPLGPATPKRCLQCNAYHGNRAYCSEQCRTEAHRVNARNAYRNKVGIPQNAPLYARTA